MNVDFDRFKEEEYQFILEISKDNMKDYIDKYIKGGWTAEANRKSFYEKLNVGRAYTLRIKGKIIGYLLLTVVDNCLCINDIQIAKEFQGKGLSKTIFLFLKELVNDLNCSGMELTVFNDNPAKRLYIRNGFKITGSRFNGNAVIMRKEMPVK